MVGGIKAGKPPRPYFEISHLAYLPQPHQIYLRRDLIDLTMYRNYVMATGALLLLRSAAGPGVRRMDDGFFGAEHVQSLFSPFQPHLHDLMRREGGCQAGFHPCMCSCTTHQALPHSALYAYQPSMARLRYQLDSMLSELSVLRCQRNDI